MPIPKHAAILLAAGLILSAGPARAATDWCLLDFGKVTDFGKDDKTDNDAIGSAVQQVQSRCPPGSKLTVQFPGQISTFVEGQLPEIKIAVCDIRYPILPLGGGHFTQDFVCTAAQPTGNQIDFPQ